MTPVCVCVCVYVCVCVAMIHEQPQADRIFALILREPPLNCCAQSAALKELLLLPAFVQSVWFEGYFHRLPLLCSRAVSMSLTVSFLCLTLARWLTYSLQDIYMHCKTQLLLITTLR